MLCMHFICSLCGGTLIAAPLAVLLDGVNTVNSEKRGENGNSAISEDAIWLHLFDFLHRNTETHPDDRDTEDTGTEGES